MEAAGIIPHQVYIPEFIVAKRNRQDTYMGCCSRSLALSLRSRPTRAPWCRGARTTPSGATGSG